MIDTIIDFLLSGINFCYDVFSRFVTGGLLEIYLYVFTIGVVGRFLIMPLMTGSLPEFGSDRSSDKVNRKKIKNNNTKKLKSGSKDTKKLNKGN